MVLKVERKQFTVLVGKANTLLERNREMYDMVNHELMEVRSHFAHCTCTRTNAKRSVSRQALNIDDLLGRRRGLRGRI